MGPGRQPVESGELAVYGPGGALGLAAGERQDSNAPNLDALILGGQPIREPVVHYGPFVMNTREEIIQALTDYQAGRLGQVPAEHMPHRHEGDADIEGTTED